MPTMHITGHLGASKDSSHELSHCFPRRALPLPRKDCWSVALISLCQACSSSYRRHINDRQPEAYRTLNKRGRIPCVFPHEDTSCSSGMQGLNGGIGSEQHFLCWRLISPAYVFLPHYLHSSTHSCLPPRIFLSSVHPTRYVWVDQKLMHWSSFCASSRRRCFDTFESEHKLIADLLIRTSFHRLVDRGTTGLEWSTQKVSGWLLLSK